MTSPTHHLPADDFRLFTWCEVGPYAKHDLCIGSYVWNDRTVHCPCECHHATA